MKSLWRSFKRLTQLGFPKRFPIVQFPNLPLIIAFIAGEAGRLLPSGFHPYSLAVAFVAMSIWAYEELVHGVNWFRVLLGLTYFVIIAIRIIKSVV